VLVLVFLGVGMILGAERMCERLLQGGDGDASAGGRSETWA
jgi:hypothetical protein